MTPPCHDRDRTLRALTCLVAMTYVVLGLQGVILASEIGLCVKAHKMAMELSGISERLAAVSESLEKR